MRESRSWKVALLYSVVAILFSLAVRQIYVEAVAPIERFYDDGTIMINTNDGYYWAEGARDILAGYHQKNDLSPVEYPVSKLTAFLVEVLGVDLDRLIFYLPGVLGSLLAIPLVLLGMELGSAFLGFLAALLAPIAWSYYHRTMYGYYDTDMLVVVLLTMAVWGIVRALRTKRVVDALAGALFLALSIWWHNGLFLVANAIFAATVAYLLLFERKKEHLPLVALLVVAVIPADLTLKLALMALLAAALAWKREVVLRSSWLFGAAVGAIYLIFGGYEWIWSVLQSGYFTRSTTIDEKGLKFYGVINTVREAGHISFDTLVHRISGSYAGFFIGAIGYLLLLLKKPRMIVSLPMVGLGLYAVWGGLRFTIFAVPFFALGDAYAILLAARWLQGFVEDERWKKVFYYAFAFGGMALLIYPNISHVREYIMPTVFNAQEVKILKRLREVAGRDDYVLAWWDYGYPIRYYADVKTLIDGGKHTGDVNFGVSFALTTPSQRASYNMAILSVHFTERFMDENIGGKTYIEGMMEYYGIEDPDRFLELLHRPISLPPVKEEIYYYLPYRMLYIFSTVAKFSQIDLKTGLEESGRFYYFSDMIQKRGDLLLLGPASVAVDLQKATVVLGSDNVPISRFAVVRFGEDGRSQVKETRISHDGLNVILLPDFGAALVVDEGYYDSTFIQLYLFQRYDPELFEPVILSPFAAVYRVKK